MDVFDRLEELDARLDALEAKVEPLERAVAKLLTVQIEAEQGAATGEPSAEAIRRSEAAARARRFEAALAAQRAEAAAQAAAQGATAAAAAATIAAPPRLPRPMPAPAERQPSAERPPSAEPVEPVAGPTPTWRVPTISLPTGGLRSTMADLEERMAGRALVFVGGVALVLGAIIFLGLAFSQGWIGEEARVALGLIAGSAGLAIGAFFMERQNRLLGHVLTPVGLAVITISLVAATQLYDLMAVPVGLALALFAAVVTAVIAIRAGSQLVAGFGLVAVLAAPPLLGATPDMTTLAFVGVALVGTTAIALWRTWPWLPPVAFALAAPQAASWLLGETNVAFGLVGLAAFTVLQAVAAGGEEFRRRRDDLSPSSASLLLASAAFLVWGGFVLLDGALDGYRATFLIVTALAYLGLGAFFLVRDGDRHLFGLLTAATGIAALTMAAPIGLGAPAVPVAWTAEAVVLAWVAIRRPHPYSALVSGGLYLLAAAWLVYMVYLPGTVPVVTVPFAHPGGVALATFLVGAAIGIALVPLLTPRRALAGLGLGVAAWCALVELSGPPVVFAEMAVAVAAAALRAGLPRLPVRVIDWRVEGLIARAWPTVVACEPIARMLVPVVAVTAGIVATAHVLVVEVVGANASWGDEPTIVTNVPFVSDAGLTLGLYLVGLMVIGWLERSAVLSRRLAALGLLVTAAVCPVELGEVALVAAWSALGILGAALWRWLPMPEATMRETGTFEASAADAPIVAHEVVEVGVSTPVVAARPLRRRLALLPATAAFIGGLAVARTLAEMWPADLGQVALPEVPFTDPATAMGAILAAAAVLAGLVVGGPQARRIGVLGAGVAVAYTIPFQVEPWAVAVLWSVLAVAALVATRLDPDGQDVYLGAGAAMLGLTAAEALLFVAPPSRLILDERIEPLVAVESLVALVSVCAATAATAWLCRVEPWARWVEVAAGVVVVYLISIGTVDAFATQVGAGTSTEQLRWQSQAALSVVWAITGMVAFVAGLRLGRAEVRVGGLMLLAVTTVKVFVIDLAALDTAYKVIALIGLGLVLLLSGGLWQRLRKRPPAAPQGPAAVHP